MKKIMAIMLAVVLSVSLVACGGTTPAKSQSAIKDGTYQGEGTGKGGAIKVEVTIASDTITGIKVLEHGETEGFDTAMTTLTDSIIKTNTVDVDLVTGCTLTSNGFIQGVKAALTAAGATPDMLKKIEINTDKTAKKDVEETHDIVVVGAGGAGFCAAIEAKMAGADVIILEKLPVAGGNTLISGAEYAAPANWLQEKEGIKDNTQL
ncbi:MAG: FMN-binding protein, partial [Oscillospiraceae bacterium]